MRIVLWHGYLLGGTGSNVYTRQLAREWSQAGHDVVVLSQEPHPERYDLGGAATARPDVGGFLPTFVLDRYEGFDDVRRVPDCTRVELDRWVDANVASIAEQQPAELVFANHVLLGGPVGAASGHAAMRSRRTARSSSTRCVATSGSRRGAPRRSAARRRRSSGRPTSARCWRTSAVTSIACTRCRRASTWPNGCRRSATPRSPGSCARRGTIRRTPGTRTSACPTSGTGSGSGRFLVGDVPTVVYFGKLIPQKGVHVLLEALQGVEARVVVVGFGPERAALERQADDLGVPALFTGPLEHRHLRHLLAFADACVVPSIFPEAFGMVAAEAAAAGCPPLVARHSGLAEVAAGLEEAYPPALAHLTSFATGDAAALRSRLQELLELAAADRAAVRAAARAAAVERWSWAGIARRLLDLAGA